ncbi:YheC/YheD family protein [Oceanobacillus timonensis]|uniref:YheC/YheD family protein n=1 Tax=Oceanobacillus timonensis TaxID=1926285 RepID=UPI0009B9F3FF|nr:YheC/YheD family protein [Oceanobacillus timonensis]
MIIGYMRNLPNPDSLARTTSLIAKSYGIELLYMNPEDVDIKEEKVQGKVLINNKWIDKKTDIPPFIDTVPYCFKPGTKEVMDFLEQETMLSEDRKNVITKEYLQDVLSKDEAFSHLMIPTHRMETLEDLHYYLRIYQKVVLKPESGLRGKNIYFMETIGKDLIRIGFNTEKWEVHLTELKAFFDHTFNGKNYFLQKYVTSRTPQGDPFDCRIHVEKNGRGRWAIAKIYVRIGIGQSVISNVNQGGGVSDAREFLKANYGEKWQEVYNQLKRIGKTIPKKMEELRGKDIMTLGLDIGIDKSGEQFYLFEVNDSPSSKVLKSEVAYFRSNYYLYVLKEKLHYNVKDPIDKVESSCNRISQLEKEIETKERIIIRKDKEIMQKDREMRCKEKRMNNILNSTSWKITSLLRKAGKVVKK